MDEALPPIYSMNTSAQTSFLIQLRDSSSDLAKRERWGQLREGMDHLAAKHVGPEGVEFDAVGNVVKLDISSTNVTGAEHALCTAHSTFC